MMHFEDLSNEVILCIWDQLLEVDVIFSFCNLNNRITSLLYKYCGLFTKLDLRYCSLSVFRYFCHQILNTIEWRLGLTVLKLGNRYRCCQLHMFTNEISNLFRLGEAKQYNDIPNDFSRLLIINEKRLQPVFPQLVSFVVFQTTHVSNECRDILLYAMAGGLTMRTFTWSACGRQTHHSTAFFDWLFLHSRNLRSYQLKTRLSQSCFELTYEHTCINGYTPHHSLINLQISVTNVVTLYTLLHYLPQLQHLGEYFKTITFLRKN